MLKTCNLPLETDIKAGKLEALADQAIEDHLAGRSSKLSPHNAQPAFWAYYRPLPPLVKEAAANWAFAQLKVEPRHPSPRFKKVGEFW